MSNETTKITRRARPVVKAALLKRVPDFCLSAEVIAATYSDDVSQDGVWGTIFDATDASADEIGFVAENAAQ